MPRSAVIWTRSRETEFELEIPPHTQHVDFLIKMPSLEEIPCRSGFLDPGSYRGIPSLSTVCTRTGKRGVQARKGQHVKSEIPRREPRVLPLIGHGEYVPGKQV